MDRQTLDLRRYWTAEGRCPFNEWMTSIKDETVRARIDARMARVRQGLLGDSKALEHGVSELRLDLGPGFRIYFGRDEQAVLILLCGGDKKTQRRNIRQAKAYWADYKRRKNETNG